MKNSKINNKFKENINLMNTPLMSILPGQISFFVILSIIPLLSILFMVISKLSINFDFISNFLVHYLPKGAADVIMLVLNEQKAGIVDSFFIITAFYLASKATHSIIVASTQIYNGKQKDFFQTRIKAIFMLLILIFLVCILVLIISFGGRLVRYLYSINTNFNPLITSVYSILKWPFTFFMVFYVVKIIYTIAPNVYIPSKSVNKGAFLTTSVWIISTYLFSFYVTNIANYNKFYGNLSNIVILMIWIYWLCYIFVYGMTINEYKLNTNLHK